MQRFTDKIRHSKEKKQKWIVSLELEASDLQLFCILTSAESFFLFFFLYLKTYSHFAGKTIGSQANISQSSELTLRKSSRMGVLILEWVRGRLLSEKKMRNCRWNLTSKGITLRKSVHRGYSQTV